MNRPSADASLSDRHDMSNLANNMLYKVLHQLQRMQCLDVFGCSRAAHPIVLCMCGKIITRWKRFVMLNIKIVQQKLVNNNIPGRVSIPSGTMSMLQTVHYFNVMWFHSPPPHTHTHSLILYILMIVFNFVLFSFCLLSERNVGESHCLLPKQWLK